MKSPLFLLAVSTVSLSFIPAHADPPPRAHVGPTTQHIVRWAPEWYIGTDYMTSGQYWTGDWGSGAWLGLRPYLIDKGVEITGSYANNIQGNVVGGTSLGAAYDHNVGMQMDLNLEKLIGWNDAHFVISALDRTGRNLSQDSIGNQFTVSQLWGNPTFVFYGLYLDQDLFNGKANIRLGRIAAGDEFASSPVYWLYVNNGICGNPQSLPVNASFTSYPNATWGARLRVQPTPEVYFQTGIYQATDRLGNPKYHGIDFSIRPNDGFSTVAQIGWKPEFNKQEVPESTPDVGKDIADKASRFGQAAREGKTVTSKNPVKQKKLAGLPGHYWLGAYWSNWEYSQFTGGDAYQNAYGFYIHADQMVYQERPGSSEGLTLWSGLTYSPQQQISKLPLLINGGMFYTGLIPTRDTDQTIFGVVYGKFSGDYAQSQRQAGLGSPSYELVFEWAYRLHLTPFLYIQPDIQWVIRPGGTGDIPNALVLGGQMGVNF